MEQNLQRGRLALVISTLTHGGAEVQVKVLGSGLRARGWDTDLVVLRRPEAFVDDLTAAGVRVHTLGVTSAASAPAAMVRLSRILRRIRPDVVHSHMRGANILTRLARPFAKPPVLICTAHNFDENVATSRFRLSAELSYRLTDRLCNLTTNVSHAAVARYIATRATPANRIRFVPNGIDVARFRRDPIARNQLRAHLNIGDRLAILAIGRFQPQKNHDLLVRAFARTLRSNPQSVLLLVGAGPLEDETRRTAADLGIEHAVKFLGLRDDVPQLLSAADIYAMSSRYEGLPIVLLEAAAAGLPVIATGVGGVPEIVETGINGIVVPSEDIDAFAAGLLRLGEMTEADRQAYGEVGRQLATERYDIERVIDEWEQIYAETRAKARAEDGSGR